MSIFLADEKIVKTRFNTSPGNFFTRILLACIALCYYCIESPGQTNRPATGVDSQPKAGTMSESLYRLYIANTSKNPQLKKLLHRSHKYRKVVFQFYHTDSGFLSLKAWPGKRRNKRFYLGEEILLGRYPQNINTPDTTLTGINVHLGDLQLNKRAVKALRAKINDDSHIDTNYNCILFIPEILVDSQNHINHVIYTIKPSTVAMASQALKASKASNVSAASASSDLSFIIRLNPSPPYSIKQDE